MLTSLHKENRLRAVSWGHWFTLVNIALTLIVGFFYFFSKTPSAGFGSEAYFFVYWLGHFSFITFGAFVLFIFPMCILFPYARFLKAWGTLVASFLLLTLILDVLFFNQYKVHLNSYALAQIVKDAEQWRAGGSFIFLMSAFFSFLVIILLQLAIANVTWKRLDRIKHIRLSTRVAPVFIGAFILSHLVHIWADASLYRSITQQDDLFPLSYPTTAKSLMSRHGFIDTSHISKQSVYSRQTQLDYPNAPLLCTRQVQAPPTFVFIFDQLSKESVYYLQAQVPELITYSGNLIGHPNRDKGFFQFIYGLSDLYYLDVLEQQRPPAYLATLEQLGYPLHIKVSKALQHSVSESPITQQLLEQQKSLESRYLQTFLYSESELNQAIPMLKQSVQQKQARVIVLAIQPSLTKSVASIEERLSVPLLTYQVPIHPNRELILLHDFLPSLIQSFVVCVDQVSSFTHGVSIQQTNKNYPRINTLDPNIYFFEDTKVSIISIDGNIESYDYLGQALLEQEAVSPSALVEGLNELQKFRVRSKKTSSDK